VTSVRRPISLTLAALGGQGGGVVCDWLTTVARSAGWLVQTTSVPGVAQRTGATIYYCEFFPRSALPADGRRPVMALMPSPGDVDIVVASEWVEAGRALERGFVTPDRTTLIASTHRDFTISEKANPGDGRADPAQILAQAQRRARRLVAFDMAALAQDHGAVVSAVVLGAIAGASGLPFAPDAYRHAIREGGIAVATNLAAFDASLDRARRGDGPDGAVAQAAASTAPPGVIPAAFAARIEQEFRAVARSTVTHGAARLMDYQDAQYARAYLDRLVPFAERDRDDAQARLTITVARGLALWMTAEDTIRVAELKLRPERYAAIAASLRVRAGQVVTVTEFMKPRVEEICGTLPAGLGRRLLGSTRWRRLLARFTGGKQVRTTSVGGFLLLRSLVALKRWRRGTLRHQEDRAAIEAWLTAIANHMHSDYALAVEIAECQRLIRGYGETWERGLEKYARILAVVQALAATDDAAGGVARLRRAATADDHGVALGRELTALGLA
jgi:indolepyruvate ferredoxin oxidoreductase, beta subunit